MFLCKAKMLCKYKDLSIYCVPTGSVCKPVPDRQQHGTDNAGDKTGRYQEVPKKDIPGMVLVMRMIIGAEDCPVTDLPLA